MEQSETHADVIETDTSEWNESNTKPGFLCLPISAQYKGEGCACKIHGQCANVHCIIKGHLQNRPNTRMTEESGMIGMIIVPILKHYEKQNQSTSAGTNDIVDEFDSIPGETEKVDPDSLYKEIDEMIQRKGTNDIADVLDLIPEEAEEVDPEEVDSLYKEIEEMIQGKLFKMTNLRKPSSIEELAMFLKATQSDEFKEMLGDKFDELANSENGAKKIKSITEYFENRGEGPRTITELKDQN